MKSVIGIDEAGRGPLAGPLAVCALRLSDESAFWKEKNVRDSKKLSLKAREEIFQKIKKEAGEDKVNFFVAFVSPTVIDKKGIAAAVRIGVARALSKIKAKDNETVLLDGSLKAPVKFTDQQTIIKGDEKEIAIALASIAAKVLRDRRMLRYHKKFPEYELENHKGYGTKNHREHIARLGLSKIHRASFCKNIIYKNENR